MLYRCGDIVVTRLAGTGDALIELRDPRTVIFVGLIHHFLADRMQVIIAVQPIGMSISNKPENWFGHPRANGGNDHSRKQLLLDGKGYHAWIEMAE